MKYKTKSVVCIPGRLKRSFPLSGKLTEAQILDFCYNFLFQELSTKISLTQTPEFHSKEGSYQECARQGAKYSLALLTINKFFNEN